MRGGSGETRSPPARELWPEDLDATIRFIAGWRACRRGPIPPEPILQDLELVAQHAADERILPQAILLP
jgi:hypothetical protein